MKKKIKIWPIVLGFVMGFAAFALYAAWSMFGEIITAANTVTRLEEGLYALEFAGDYGFEDFLQQGGAASDEAVAAYLTQFLSRGFYTVEAESGAFGCSTLRVENEQGNTLFGRNYDWTKCQTMLVHTKPKDGYESVSTCDLEFLGFGEDYRPDGGMMDKIMSLAAVYVPLDGMNEKGLMVADLMAGGTEATHQQGAKADLTTTTAIRLLLDRAATVDEALALLRQYNMHSSIGAAHHLSLCDASGRSVVVEYLDNEMSVIETPVVTNHYLTPSPSSAGSEQSHRRFDTLMAARQQSGGVMTLETLRQTMRSVAQCNYPQSSDRYEMTVWTVLYDPAAGAVEFCFAEQYETGYTAVLGAEKFAWAKQ